MAKEHEGERRKHRARGGATGHEHNPKLNMYNAHGSPAEKSAMDTKDDGFKRGGHVKKRKHGGRVEGEHEKKHLGKEHRGHHKGREHGHEHHPVERKRGGSVPKRARGGSPYSSAHALTGPGDKGEQGHEDEGVPKEVP